MNAVREEALKMRLRGHSYNEIQNLLGIPKSTQSGWFRHVLLSDKATARLKGRVLQGTTNAFLKRNKQQTHHAEERAKEKRGQGKASVPSLSRNDLRIIGATLYWAEGYKRLKIRDGKERMDHKISFVNADGEMVRIFLRFLIEIMGIPSQKIRVNMRLYPHINENAALQYWMQTTGIPREQFWKTSYPVSNLSKRIRPINRLPWGTLQIEVCDTAKFHYLLGLIEGVKGHL